MKKPVLNSDFYGQHDLLIINKKFKDVNPRVCGEQNCRPGNRYGPHTRNYYLIHYIVSGQGTLQNASGVYPVKAGQIFVIYPGEVTVYTADEKEPWHYIWIGFDGRLGRRLEELPSPVVSYAADTFFSIVKADKMMAMREEYLTGKIFEIFSVLFEKEKKLDVIEQVENFISANYQRNIRVEEIARMVKYDRHYLARIFRERRGMTITEYITEKRMKEAAVLLQNNSMVSETAKLLGYEDPFVFSKAFKRYYGISPQSYHRDGE